ncbi:hypothetical protein ACC806_34595 [Rhizobium ruizarguesonis]
MSAELPVLWRTRPDHTVGVFYEHDSRRFRIQVWHGSGLTATVWIRADHEPQWGVDSEDMDAIERHVTVITRDLELASGGRNQ